MQARKLELHICEQSGIQDNFQAATDALRYYNVVDHHHLYTTHEDDTSSISPFK
jgi:hypothetical protein